MNKQQSQYNEYLKNLGYSPVFFPERNSFQIKNIYLKICDDHPSDKIVRKAEEKSKDIQVILLCGNLTFTDYRIFMDGEECCSGFLTVSGSKYSPIYYGGFEVEYFDDEAKAIADAISGPDVIKCKRCNRSGKYKVVKNLHYKAVCDCGCFIKNISANKPLKFHFGKYAGREISSMKTDEEISYLKWALNSMTSLKQSFIEEIKLHLSNNI